jgi:uncharacterized membrane protein YidH (DUF202 family)
MTDAEPSGSEPVGGDHRVRASGSEPVGGDHDVEDGLQRERTALAWTRTALALMVAGSLLIRYLGAPFFDVYHVPAYSALASGLVLLWLAARDQRWRAKPDTAPVRPGRTLAVGIAAFTVGVASLLIVAVGR